MGKAHRAIALRRPESGDQTTSPAPPAPHAQNAAGPASWRFEAVRAAVEMTKFRLKTATAD